MYETFVEINSLKTQVLSWGRELSDSFDDVNEIVLLLCGAAGIPEYYSTYLETIYEGLNREVPIFVCAHAGFVEKEEFDTPELEGNEHLFNASGNIRHKVCI